MAGDWIKVEKATARKPEVLRIAGLLNIHPDEAFGLCVRFWCWCDDHLISCNAHGVTSLLLDALIGRTGFADALISVGWLRVREGSLEVPNFDRHLSQSAKRRAFTAQRVAETRKRKCNTQSVTKALPEKRREEKKEITPISPSAPPNIPAEIATDSFRAALNTWLDYKAERRESYKPTGLQQMLSLAANRAKQHGLPAVIAAMQKAMANGWKGWDQDGAFATSPPKETGTRLLTDEEIDELNRKARAAYEAR